MTHGFRALLPSAVEVEVATDDADGASPFDAERAAVARAVPVRRAEFFTVRACARRALARLGQPPVAIVPGPGREPVWPAGVVGSMTHCRGRRAAAVARSDEILVLGIDVELHAPLPEGVAELVMSPAERGRLDELGRIQPSVAWDRVVFSAKESVFKAWYPLARSWLDFLECDLELDARTGTFDARLLVPGPLIGLDRLQVLRGRWATEGGFITTAVWEAAAPTRR
ncbi:4'-phosphopantetheinyl transferase family protein [Clavibacter michiganensis]|uniref:4'-phosphopantetheinyl transferase n=4 Tax=Clavibacter michiganensis TaxID=28447 RepID=A0A0D5CKJ3_9MICO|nr:4'-phosphopantetheinyl transferase superfamily protein [Clavibacter michiganensis]AJW79829.1 hypothetical protein VO01_12485 [Clavibacter michiganensis subsp. insidiosus]AWF99229.1 hypothetical protein BEH61_12030 [Clavibacter michiganensis subsp. insidiosus]AWG00658.1 hypothetical protein BEH62_03475 [Clavibacter michiganensis subsp. insidiosus]OQJ60735.1 hypothetical protein B5P21_13055 [Clavibacter michiganensis subsp. insidiosus]